MWDSLSVEKALLIETVNPLPELQSNQLTVRKVTRENVQEALWFNSPEIIFWFLKFLEAGHTGYYCYKDNICISRTWIFKNSQNTFVGKNFIYKLKKDEYFSGWSETAKEYYGIGAFSFTLNHAIREYPDKKIVGYIAPDNIGSIKATQKAGFLITRRLLLIRFYKIRFFIQKKYNNHRLAVRVQLGSVIK